MAKSKVIKGVFHVQGYSPDGDSIRFEADDPKNWKWTGFKWSSAAGQKRKRKQLRIEAIDALETHYRGVSQPGAFAVAATEVLLEMLGVRNVVFNLAVNNIDTADDRSPGSIVSAGLDIYDRPICFVFPGATDLEDGAEIEASEVPWRDSMNYHLLDRGLVYPSFYDSLDEGIREEFRKATRRMRKNCKGIWAVDRTMGFELWNTHTVENRVVIMPKLFRRIVRFFEARAEMSELRDYLDNIRDRVVILNTGENVRLENLIQVNGRMVGLTVLPEDMMNIAG